MSQKRLYLSRNKVIGGVAGGIAEYFDVDPTIIRLLFVLALLNPPLIGGYILAMIIIPEKPVVSNHEAKGATTESEKEAVEELKKAAQELVETGGEVANDVVQRIKQSLEKVNDNESQDDLQSSRETTELPEEREHSTSSQRNLGIILLGVGLLFLTRSVWPWIPWGTIWPVGIVLVGVFLLVRGMGGK